MLLEAVGLVFYVINFLTFYYAPNHDTVILTVGLGCGLSSRSVSPVRIFLGDAFSIFFTLLEPVFLSAANMFLRLKKSRASFLDDET